VTVDVGDTVFFRVRLSNTGNTTLTGLVVEDGMPACTLTRGTDLSGNNDNVFEAGEEWLYTCSVTAVEGTNNNTATADVNETSQDSDTASYIAGAAVIADPALSKSGSPSQAAVGESDTFTLTVTNEGTAPASNVVVTDPLPGMFDVTAVSVTGAPLGTLVSVTPPIGTGPAPYTVVVTLGGDLEVADVVTISIVTTVNSLGSPPVSNTASLTTSSLTDVISNNSALVTLTLRSARPRLPATGFARGIETVLPSQPSDLAYAPTDVLIEIPSLKVKIPIVGVPKKNGVWNVSWLGNQVGWLEGSAFPSWSGNSLLTSHIYLSNGLPGPFLNLKELKYGDRIIVHAYGQRYIFAVQTNAIVEPTDASVMKHEERSWLTLVTCRDYDEQTGTYKKRVAVRAVLVSVEWD
jgi:LPXTG-site transpeptidase (sortase) family protein